MKIVNLFTVIFLLLTSPVFSQDAGATDTKKEEKKKEKPVRSPFESGLIINNQTIVIPSAHTLEFDIQHRFGKTENGIKDIFGIYAPSNIRIALNFSITDKILVGAGSTKNSKLQDLYWKWNIIQQTRSGSIPIAITYYGNVVYDARDKENFDKSSHRISYFHQLIFARKFSPMFSLQIAPSFAHYNVVDTATYTDLKHDNITISVTGRAKITPQTSILVEYDHQLTTPEMIKPNLAFGIEVATGSHAFQIFLGTFDGIINQQNNTFNTNDFTDDGMLFGFNITRLWNF